MTPRSLTARLWQPTPTPPKATVLARTLGLPPLVAQLLAQRGYTQPTAAADFLHPKLSHLPDPATLKGMPEALALLTTALQNKETIAIFGDYDVDGTCATALLVRYFRALGVTPLVHIPHRLTEGYGPTPEAFENLIAKGAKLIITVDTGIVAHTAIQAANAHGVPVLVTDHHQPSDTLPPAAAILNPHRPDDTSTLQTLCGSGVVFYLLMALNRALRAQGLFTPEHPEPKLTQMLDLVALATVADVMPLTGPNRVFVSLGLKQLATWQNRGLAALAHVAGVKEDALSTYTLGFQLGPRLNAAGRIESAQSALALLTAQTDEEATPLAEELNALNQQRQAVEKHVQQQALAQAQNPTHAESPALVIWGEDWHPGVVGIVAGRIKEAMGRPTFILTRNPATGQLTGSARSLPGLNVGAAVQAAAAHIIKGGGHAMAAGVTVEYENITAFQASIVSYMEQSITANPTTFPPTLPMAQRLSPPLPVHATLTPAGASLELVSQLAQLGPFGPENPEPMLALGPVVISHAQTMGAEQQHLRLSLPPTADGTRLCAVAFNVMHGPLGSALMQHAGRPVTLLGHLRPNTFNGRTSLDFHITDATWGTWQPQEKQEKAA